MAAPEVAAADKAQRALGKFDHRRAFAVHASPAALRIAIDSAPARLRVIKCRGAVAPTRPLPFPAAAPAAA